MQHIFITYSPTDLPAALALKLRLLSWNRSHSLLRLDREMFSADASDRNSLIVLCSPRAASDPGVEADILRFCSREPLSHVVPYVIRGIPNAKNPAKECFPSPLRRHGEEELLAANRVSLGAQRAVNKIISGICGIPLAELERRSRKQRIRRTAAALLLLTFFLVYTALSEYTINTRTEYYRGIRYQNHVPVGVDRMSFLGKLFASDYYVFDINYKSVLWVTRVGNPPGFVPENKILASYFSAINTPIIHFTYHTDGNPDASIHMDADGNVLFVINYLAGTTAADFSTDATGIEPYYLFPKETQVPCSRCVFTYDPQGMLTEITWYPNSRNLPA